MAKTPRPSGPKIDLTSGVPDDVENAEPEAQALDPNGKPGSDDAPPEGARSDLTLGELLNLSMPTDDPQLLGMITDEQVPASQITDASVTQQPGYSDMINSLAAPSAHTDGAQGRQPSYSSAMNDLAQAGASADPTSIAKAAAKPKSKQKPSAKDHVDLSPPAPAVTGSADLKFVSRIRITEAYQYFPATLAQAPIWVDRNWVGYHGQHDSVRGLEPGPCLRVPDPSDDTRVIVARAGDYVVMQDVQVDGGGSIIEIEVWEKEQFERLFMHVMEARA
jgi:hypothetical protein